MGQLRKLVLLSISALFASDLAAQSSSRRITGVVIDRQSIFDQAESSFWVSRIINGLHFTTTQGVIRRELLFHVGDTLNPLRLAESERNLRRLGVFRSVEIDTTRSDSGLVVRVATRDGWSTRVDPRFSATDGQFTWSLALIEDNLFGTTTKAQATWRDEPDRTTAVFQLRQPRLISGRVGGQLSYFDRSDGRIFAVSLGRPFFTASDRGAFQFDFDTRRERILQFREGPDQATDTLQHRFVLGRVTAMQALHASSREYLRVGGLAQVTRENIARQSVVDSVGGIPGRNVAGAFGVTAEYSRLDYLKVKGFQSFDRYEDVNLSRTVTASLLLAPRSLGYARDGIAPLLIARGGSRIPGGFIQGEIWAGGLFTSAGLDSGRAGVGATAVFLPGNGQHVVLHAEAAAARNPHPGSEFELGGGGLGPRAFRQHALTGDRMYTASAEYRRMLIPDLFRFASFGVAAFIDHGGAGWSGGPVRRGTDFGVGGRLNLTRASEGDAVRFDLAWRLAEGRQPGGLVFTVGKGFTFTVRP